MLAKRTSKNQVTLPKEIAGKFPDIQYFDVSVRGAKIILMPVKMAPAGGSLSGIREKLKKLGIQPGEVARAVRWARKIKRQSA